MCAILGGNNINWNYQEGIESMHHRGPDGIRVECVDEITFAFARLAIIDLSLNGMQPMFSEDKQICIVFNGEIYKYQKLKEQLEQKYCFRSTTDTEVILYAYMEYGDRFINKIDGMFAIAIYDRRCRKIKLFRDRVGIKPLYYYINGYEFGFSSELKGLVKMMNSKALKVDKTALYDFLTYTYIPEPKSVYQNIYKLEPAHFLVFDTKEKKLEKKAAYWKLRVNTHEKGKNDYGAVKYELRSKISRSVKSQMIADVPVGTLLSGGVDSSVVTYECHCCDENVKTFSMGFEAKDYDEIQYARELVHLWNLNNHEGVFGNDTFQSLYANVKEWFDEPYADVSAFPTYDVLRMAKEYGVTVLLTGDGGDEVFGGYDVVKALYEKRGMSLRILSDTYENLIRERIVHKKEFDNFFLDGVAFFSKKRNWALRDRKKKYAKRFGIPRDYDDYWFIRKHYHKELPPMTRAQIIDFHTFLPFVLNKVDRTSMALSLEVRVPLLDREVIEYSFSLPQEIRCQNRQQKELLKQAYPEIPNSVKYRSKQGFGMPGQYISRRKRPCEEMLRGIWGDML